jgi:hypothetical protein
VRAAGGFCKYYVTNFISNVCREDATQDEREEEVRHCSNSYHFHVRISPGILGLKCLMKCKEARLTLSTP